VKEGTFWRGSAILVFAVGGILITAAAIAVCLPWFGLVDLREVVIAGNHHATAAEIVSLAHLHRGQSLLTMSLRRVSDDLLQHHWIKDVSVKRRWLHTLEIRVQERMEVAWMSDPSGNGCLAVGEGGVVVSTDCSRSASWIELRGARFLGDGVGATLADATIVRLIDAFEVGELASLGVRRIDLTNPDSVELETGSGLRVLLGDRNEVLLRLDSLAALSRSLDVEDYEVIDLRFGGEATLVPR